MMKILNKLLLLTLVTATLSSCDDLLTEKPDSYYAADNFFISTENAEMAVFGIYDVLNRIEHYGEYEIFVQTCDGQYAVKGVGGTANGRDLVHYYLTPACTFIEPIWKLKYTGIDRANYFLANVKEMELYKDGNQELKSLEGEACFLRAMLYFDLIRYWGDVPFKTDYSNSATDGTLPRTDRMVIYNQIIADLNIAKEQLPVAYSPERASQGAARALLMRVYLHKAGYSLKQNGVLSRPDENIRETCYNAVIDEFVQIVNSGSHFLNPDYEQLWKNYSEGILEPHESMFEISFFNSSGGKEDSGLWGSWIGPLTDQNSSYGRANAFMVVTDGTNWYNFYDPLDVRRDVNICRYSVNAKDQRVAISSSSTWTPGKWRREWMGTSPKDVNYTDVNFVTIRYADVILMAAEAYNELGNNNEAVSLINQIRTRAGVAEINSDLTNYESIYKKEKMADHTFLDDSDLTGKIRRILYWERGFELCYEHVRKYDLIRWGILDPVLKSIPRTSNYGASEFFISGKHELLPIPLREMDINPALNGINNPGY
jgi:hypothetical protein